MFKKKPRIAALVPMRHQSERVPGKNYRLFAGKPLYHHIISSLLACQYIGEICINTDSPFIISDAPKHFPVRLIVLHQLFPEQKFHFWNCLTLWFLNTVTDYYCAMRERKLLKNFLQIPLFRLMQFLGTYRGYVRRNTVSDGLRRKFYYPSELNKKPAQAKTMVSSEDYIDYSGHIHGG